MNHTADAKQFCHHLWHQYLEERSYEIPGGYFSPQISVIGTGKHEVSHSLQEFAVLLEREEKQWNGTFVIEQEAYQARQLSDNVYMVYGELDVNEDARDRINYELHFRFTIILQYTPSGWELLHVHQSVPDINQCSDEFFPKRLIEQSNEQLREKIAQKTRELQESNKAVLYYSHHDYLTKLTNRYYCEKQIEEQLRNGKQGTILMMDVDHFKFYNDTYGHPVGDRILITLAQALQKTFSKDIVSRIGGAPDIWTTACWNTFSHNFVSTGRMNKGSFPLHSTSRSALVSLIFRSTAVPIRSCFKRSTPPCITPKRACIVTGFTLMRNR